MVLRLIRALLGEAAFLAPVVSGKTPANVAPGSRRQDHTTSPYAAAFSSGVFCLGAILVGKTGFHFSADHTATPDATASIASRTLRIVTIAKRPSVGTGRRD